MIVQQLTDLAGAVIAGVIEDEDQSPLGVGLQQLAQELGELPGILLGIYHVVRLACPEVDRPVNAQALIRARSRDDGANSSKCPDLGQGRVEMNLTFIEVEQIEVGSAT